MYKRISTPKLLSIFSSVAFILFCLFSHFTANAQQLSIACIGNSITAGARLTQPKTESYPAVLSSMLKQGEYLNYEVKNFGIGGATILRFGTPNLWPIIDSLQNLRPDIVIIKAGTNETVGSPRLNWEHINEFENDYSGYISLIRKINPECRIVICSPLDMVIQTEGLSSERIADLNGRRPRIWELRKRIKKIARSEQVSFLDLTRPFVGKAKLMTKSDGVHPNLEGYHYLASLVYDYLVKSKIVVK
ncbi:MAG: GDSL-type esterase/lipase family protein [Daejeonella sp.]|uniref:GDSL-type esterase/lipase family protein n=1 Tax=Daejeonella sp. TaxID=2805397 RepID=UPI002732D38E|nr:GDSL-type esterase/lipase family protein [Daejeonella sp.]MDP3467323.1 GDSL-type esterase/lipase family protein [Daejeonella sp.]